MRPALVLGVGVLLAFGGCSASRTRTVSTTAAVAAGASDVPHVLAQLGGCLSQTPVAVLGIKPTSQWSCAGGVTVLEFATHHDLVALDTAETASCATLATSPRSGVTHSVSGVEGDRWSAGPLAGAATVAAAEALRAKTGGTVVTFGPC